MGVRDLADANLPTDGAGMTPTIPTGHSAKARFDRWKYDTAKAGSRKSIGFLTSVTTRGTFRKPIVQRRRRPVDEGEFDVTWVFRFAGTDIIGASADYHTDVPIVEGGITFASSVKEREFLSLGNVQGAIESDDEGDSNSFLMAQSKLFNPGSRIRVQLTCDPLGKNSTVHNFDIEPCLYLRLSEAPFSPGQKPSSGTDSDFVDSTKGFKPAKVRYDSARSIEGFHVYNFGPLDNALIIPDSRVLGILVAPNAMLKPRPDWNGVFIQYGYGINTLSGSLVLSEQTDAPFVFEPYLRNLWYTPSSQAGEIRRNLFAETTVMPGSEIFWQAVSRGFADGFEITIDSQPNDGDFFRVSYSNRQFSGSTELRDAKFKTVVSDPQTEIEIGATLAGTRDNFDAFLKTTGGRTVFASAAQVAAYRLDSGRWITINPGASVIFNLVLPRIGQPAQTKVLQRYTPLIKVGNFGTVTRVLEIGKENTWAPSPNAYGKPTGSGGNSDSCFRSDWMAIPLTANFDQTIDLPAFTKPYFVQAFYGRFLDIHPDRTIPQFEINLNVSPA